MKKNKRMVSCQTGPGQLSPYQINLPAKQFDVSHLHCFLTAAWLLGQGIIPEKKQRYLMQRGTDSSHKLREGWAQDWLRHSCPCCCRPISDLEVAGRRLRPRSCPTAVIAGRHHITCVCGRQDGCVCASMSTCLLAFVCACESAIT